MVIVFFLCKSLGSYHCILLIAMTSVVILSILFLAQASCSLIKRFTLLLDSKTSWSLYHYIVDFIVHLLCAMVSNRGDFLLASTNEEHRYEGVTLSANKLLIIIRFITFIIQHLTITGIVPLTWIFSNASSYTLHSSILQVTSMIHVILGRIQNFSPDTFREATLLLLIFFSNFFI